MKNLKDILDQEKQYIEAKKDEHPTGTLTITFHKPTGEANLYIWFRYGPQIIFNHTRRQVSGSINTDLIITNKQVNNQQCKYDN